MAEPIVERRDRALGQYLRVYPDRLEVKEWVTGPRVIPMREISDVRLDSRGKLIIRTAHSGKLVFKLHDPEEVYTAITRNLSTTRNLAPAEPLAEDPQEALFPQEQGPTEQRKQAAQGGRGVSDPEIPAWAQALGALVLGLLIFGVCVGLGVNAGYSLIIAIVVTAVGMSKPHGKARKKILTRTAPARSRTIPQDVKIAVSVRDGGRCRVCGSTVGLHYDHILPYSRGGRSDDVNNIQLLCARHNLRKGNRYVG